MVGASFARILYKHICWINTDIDIFAHLSHAVSILILLIQSITISQNFKFHVVAFSF